MQLLSRHNLMQASLRWNSSNWVHLRLVLVLFVEKINVLMIFSVLFWGKVKFNYVPISNVHRGSNHKLITFWYSVLQSYEVFDLTTVSFKSILSVLSNRKEGFAISTMPAIRTAPENMIIIAYEVRNEVIEINFSNIVD